MSEQIRQNRQARPQNPREDEASPLPAPHENIYQENKEQLDVFREIIAELLSDDKERGEANEIVLRPQQERKRFVFHLSAERLVGDFQQPGGE